MEPNPLSSSPLGVLLSYQVVVRGLDANNGNLSRILTNMTVDSHTPSILLANLTAGIKYSVSVAAATTVGYGPFSAPVLLRLDPHTNTLDHSFTR